MFGCPHCKHWVWSTDASAKHIHTHHPGFPMFVKVKLKCVMPKESEEFLTVLTASEIPSDVPSTST